MTPTDDETTTHLYHMVVDFLGKASVQSKQVIEQVRERLKVEGARHSDADSLALRCVANALEAYLNDAD